ncbi:MAG: ubiquinol-cytochrome c reductase iron-sulfur subunit [Legionellales bacterium]|nr:ubiquinol-cytochrome c reductase iron-sulfur subunit [Legionellales bacterium]|tara:strand:+ start:2224 stop:2808 length:585 start_codon:yes stop_codon:yes gene_type:complete
MQEPIDKDRRRFLVKASSSLAAIGAAFAAIPLIASWLPSARARSAGAPIEVDISDIPPGEMKVVEWRGKPVWIIRRDPDMLKRLENSQAPLRDPHSDASLQPEYAHNLHRSVNPEFLILVGICTHLGCAPTYVPGIGKLGKDWPGGFYCPCHGSKFDLAGRVFTGVPAPINLEVPPYRFVDNATVMIGEDTGAA